jgi:hypothetical protein
MAVRVLGISVRVIAEKFQVSAGTVLRETAKPDGLLCGAGGRMVFQGVQLAHPFAGSRAEGHVWGVSARIAIANLVVK